MPLPSDIDPHSGSRLPPVRREDLDPAGRLEYDALAARTGSTSLAGLRGPGGLNLHSPRAAVHLNALSRYLRYGSSLTPRVRETAILAVARETDQPFEWAAHESYALGEGVPAATVEAIRMRGALAALDAADAVVIELVRAVLTAHRVDAALYARAKAALGETVLVELAMLIGNYTFVSAMLTVFDVQLPAGQADRLPPR